MKLFQYTISLAILLPLQLWSVAQELVIVNETTGAEVEHVAIFNQDKSRSTLSNLEGKASLEHFSTGDSLFFQHASFESYACTYTEALAKGKVVLSRKVLIMPEFIVTASKYRETQRDIPHMADVITPGELEFTTAQTSAEVLTSTGNVFVQKSQGGGGSPVLRGFEANKILLVVDGVRMNNAIYRGGHLQNSITLDNAILERTEIVYGPNAIMYGSDALGGVVHYMTRNPKLATNKDSKEFGANASVQAASANTSWKGHFDFNVGGTKLASLTSITRAEYGDIRMGSRRNPFLGDYGKSFASVETFNSIDSIVANENPLIQKKTGFDQMDLLQKFRYRPNERLDLMANLQYSTSSDIPRYDMLNDTSDDGNLKYAVWSYGPQKRLLSSLKASYRADNMAFNNLTAIFAYQAIEESRIKRKYRSLEETTQREKLDIYSLSLDFIKNLNHRHRLIYGLESNFNAIDSRAIMLDVETGEESRALTRYPDEGSATGSYAGYISLRGNLSERWKYELGARYNYTRLQAAYSDSVDNIPYKSLDIDNSAYTGSLGIIYLPSLSTKVNLLLSTGYRIPNLDDMAKIRAKSGKITFPNPNVRPEYTYNAELGISKIYDGYLQLNANYFASYLTGLIVRVPYTFENGLDSMLFENDYYKAYVNDNSDRGIIHGFSTHVISDLNSDISFSGTLNYTYGRDLSNDAPLAHIPPIFGRAAFLYKGKKFTQECSFVYNGWKKFKDMALTGEDNEEEGTLHGFPGWYTINVKTTYRVGQYATLIFAVENLMDNFYKPFATAVAAPGINFIGTLRVSI